MDYNRGTVEWFPKHSPDQISIKNPKLLDKMPGKQGSKGSDRIEYAILETFRPCYVDKQYSDILPASITWKILLEHLIS